MNLNRPGVIAGYVSLIGVVLGARLAYQDNFLTYSQMLTKGFSVGLPLLYHGGVWSDLLIITPLIAILVSRYWSVWAKRPFAISTCVAICIAIGIVMCSSYDGGPIPEAHTYSGVRSPAGWEHMFYMSYVLFFILMFYIGTPHKLIPLSFAIKVSGVLAFHVLIGTHTILKIWDPTRFGFHGFEIGELAPTGIVGAVLVGLSWFIIAVR